MSISLNRKPRHGNRIDAGGVFLQADNKMASPGRDEAASMVGREAESWLKR